MPRMYQTRFPITLSFVAFLAACDSGTIVDGDGKTHIHANGNCNGKNNCNNNEADTQITTASGDSTDSGDETSTSGGPDMPDTGDSTDTDTETGDSTDTEESGETDTGEPEPEPGLPGCGNGLPFAGDFCYHPHVQYAITGARNAKIGDMNGDGHADVVTLSATQLAVYLNNGSGVLALSGFVPVVTGSFFHALGDIDADGDIDVAVGGQATIRVHFNNGAGVLSTVTAYNAFLSPSETLLADLDEDGDLDLAYVASGDGRKLAVRKNNGLGNFGAQVAYEVESTSNPIYLSAADFDGDGALDLLLATSVNPVILYNYGNGTFDAINEQIVEMTANMLNLAVDDYDLDGHLDIAGAKTNTAHIRVIYGMGQRMFDPMMLDVVTAVADPGPLINGDFDVDGIPDLVVATDTGGVGQIGISRGDGFGAFYDAVVYTSKNDGISLTSGDLNGDDVLDIVMVSSGVSAGLSVVLSNP
jgi:hypothetical protein